MASKQDRAEARKELVQRIINDIKGAKKHFEKPFKKMRADMDLVVKGHADDAFSLIDGEIYDDELYVANIVHRHIQQRTAALYAKNPQASARMRERKVYKVWDEDPKSLMAAQQAVMSAEVDMATGRPVGVDDALAILEDYQQGTVMRDTLQGVADTLVLLFHYFMDEQEPSFKLQMKQLVRRTLTTGVGYIKLGFQREYQNRPEITTQIEDYTKRLAHIDHLMNDVKEEGGETDADYAELEAALKALKEKENILIREGLLFEFPPSTTVIVDPKCRFLRGFVGADWVAQEYEMTYEEIEEVYSLKLPEENSGAADAENWEAKYLIYGDEAEKEAVLVWEYYHKPSGVKYTVSEAFEEFLEEPASPDVQVENFFPYRVLMFNEVEHEKDLYPPSDVSLMRSQQLEHNRTRQALREHRIASAPQYAATEAVQEADLQNLIANIPHSVTKVQGLMGTQKISDVLQQIQKAPIDPNHYTTNHVTEDVFLVVGSQEADLGAVSGATATETSLAASSRSTALTSNVDDLDDFFTDVSRAGGQIILREMTYEQVVEIVGPGAVWPEFSTDQIVEEIYLEIMAGSSGRPNKAEDIALIERLLPYLLQIQGIDQIELAKELLRRFDDKLDLNKLILPGVPSTVATNQMVQPSTGDPSSDPNAQGAQGASSVPSGPAEAVGPEAPIGPSQEGGTLPV